MPTTLSVSSQPRIFLSTADFGRLEALASASLDRFPAAASLLLVRNRQVIAPPTAGVLGSISSGVVEELCLETGLEFLRKDLWPNDLAEADEALLASTPYCLGPVTRFNDSDVGSGEPGPVYDQLMTAWDRLVEIDIRKQVQQGAAHRGGPQLIHETENRS